MIEFDAGSLVLTAFGRSNAGTVRGDPAIADRYLNLFFPIHQERPRPARRGGL